MDANATSTPRRPRFVRHRFGKPDFVIQPRDYEIVRIVSDHRVISSEDVHLLVGSSPQGVLRRLQKLFHHSYLDRPRSQRRLGNAPMIYALGQRGADLIAAENGLKPTVDWSEKNRQLQSHYLEHALMISRFQVALRYAAVSSGRVVLERWLPDGEIRDAVWIEHQDRRERIPVAPDAFFVLRDVDGRVHGFLEADRGTMTVARFTAKLRGYFAYWRSGQATQHLGMKNFVVVTVTTSAERAQHLREAAEVVSDRGLGMFLLAPEADYLPAMDRAIFNPIWRTPMESVRHSLLE